MKRWVVTAALGALVAASTPVFGQESAPPEIVGVRVGFGGCYKPGLWTPVEVLVRGGGRPMTCQLALVAPDGDGVPCRVMTPPDQACQVEPGRDSSVLSYVRFGRIESSLSVELREGDRVVAQRVFEAGDVGPESRFPKALPSSERLIVVVGPEVLGPDVLGVDEAVAVLQRHGSDHATAVGLGLDDFRRMPTRWIGYEGVEAMILSTGRPEIYRSLQPDSPQIAALGEWVQLGGTLVLSVGRNAAELLPTGAPLHSLAPGKFQQLLPLRQATALESYCASGTVVSPLIGAKQELRAAQLTEVQGTVEAREGKDLPLVIRRTWGFGQVVFTGVDLDLPPLSQWPGRALLVRRLLDISESSAAEIPQSSTVMHFGFDDMAGQLRSALDQFSGIPAVSFWVVVGVFLGYLVLIGPVDYFLLRRVLRRMELTWLTFPPVVLAVCIAAYFAAHGLKGETLRVNQVDLVDVDCQSGLLRGMSWATLFSPQTRPYDISFMPRPDNMREYVPPERWGDSTRGWGFESSWMWEGSLLVSWFGLPGSGLGGMAPKTANPVAWEHPYEISPQLNRLVGVPIQVWSTKSLSARWSGRVRPGVEAELTEQSFTPVGKLTNRLDFPLCECLLVYGRWVYELGTLQPGEPFSITSTQPRRDLRSFLFGRGVHAEGEEKGSNRYDPASIDVKDILRTMTFFEAAGGLRHTGLVNRYQGFVDLSDLLKANRAVLVAEAPAGGSQSRFHGSELLSSGQPVADSQDRHPTYYRFVLPVGRMMNDK
jgi:hypothetical protein